MELKVKRSIYKMYLRVNAKRKNLSTACSYEWHANKLLPASCKTKSDVVDVSGLTIDTLSYRFASSSNFMMNWKSKNRCKTSKRLHQWGLSMSSSFIACEVGSPIDGTGKPDWWNWEAKDDINDSSRKWMVAKRPWCCQRRPHAALDELRAPGTFEAVASRRTGRSTRSTNISYTLGSQSGCILVTSAPS